MNKELYQERLKALEKFTPLLSHYTVQSLSPSNLSRSSTTGSSTTVTAKSSSAAHLALKRQKEHFPRNSQGSSLTSLSSYHKSQSKTQPGRPSLAQRMNAYLHRNDMDPVGGALCLLPSLDFRNAEDDVCGITGAESDLDTQGSVSSMNTMASNAADLILPTLGQHHHPDHSSSLMGREDISSTQKIPSMAASVFDMLSFTTQEMTVSNSVSPNNNDEDDDANNNMNENSGEETKSLEAKDSNTDESNTAAQNLSRSISYTRSSISQAPSTLQANLLSSFQSLVDSRVKAWTLLLLRHSLAKGDVESRQRLLSLLAAQQDIVPASVVMDWALVERSAGEKDMQCHQVLDMWKRKEEKSSDNRPMVKKEGQKEEIHGLANTDHDSMTIGQIWRRIPTHECDLVIPVRMTVMVDMVIQEKIMTIQLTAPGTLAAMYHPTTSKIRYLEAKLDTNLLINSMVEQARLVVFEAVARATSLGVKKGGEESRVAGVVGAGQGSTVATSGNVTMQSSTMAGDLPDRSLMKFGSALTLKSSSGPDNGGALRSPIEQASARSGMAQLRSSHLISASLHSKSQPSLSEIKATASARRFSDLLKSKPKLIEKSLSSANSRNNPVEAENTGQYAQRTSQPRLKMPERRQRSVTWTQPESITEPPPSQSNANESFNVAASNTIQSSPAPKRRKLMSGSLKRSSKSFGKPDANTFSSVRNATFGEFGHLKHAHVLDMMGKQKNPEMAGPSTGIQLSYHASTAQLGQHRSALRNSTWSSNRMSCLDTTQSISREGDDTQIVSSHSSLSSGSGCITGDDKRESNDVIPMNASYQSQVQRAVSSSTINALLNRSAENKSGGSNTVGILKRTPTQLEGLLLSAARGGSKKS